jgi:hypothetical protein
MADFFGYRLNGPKDVLRRHRHGELRATDTYVDEIALQAVPAIYLVPSDRWSPNPARTSSVSAPHRRIRGVRETRNQ